MVDLSKIKETKKPKFKAIGSSGLTRYGGYVYEEFMSNLRWPYAGKVYKEMELNDAVVGAMLLIAEMMIRKAKWTVKASGTKPIDIEAKEFLESCMDDMSISWKDTISEILSMLPYGFSFHEVVYKYRRGLDANTSKTRSKHSDGRVGWKRIAIRAQDTLHEWEFAEDGDIKAFVQLAPPNYEVVKIPMSRGLLFRTRIQKDNPEGRSLLRNAYRSWYFKKNTEELEGIGMERDLAGLPVLTAPENIDIWNEEDPLMVAMKTAAIDLLKNIRRDAEEGVLLQEGWDLKLLNTGSSRAFDTTAIINRYDHRIAITMLADLVLIGGDKTGSFALADTKRSMLAAALEAIIQSIADVFNKYAVSKLFEYNYFAGLEQNPKIVAGEVETPSLKELALLLRSMGLDIGKDLTLQNYLREIASLPTLTEEEHDKLYIKPVEDAAKLEADKAKVIVGANLGEGDAEDKITNQLEGSDDAYINQKS